MQFSPTHAFIIDGAKAKKDTDALCVSALLRI